MHIVQYANTNIYPGFESIQYKIFKPGNPKLITQPVLSRNGVKHEIVQIWIAFI